MAHTYEKISIAGRIVKVANGTRGHGAPGDSQTVNVCDQSNREGNYEQVYRIRGADRFVRVGEITRNATTLEELDIFLIQRGAVREGPRRLS